MTEPITKKLTAQIADRLLTKAIHHYRICEEQRDNLTYKSCAMCASLRGILGKEYVEITDIGLEYIMEEY